MRFSRLFRIALLLALPVLASPAWAAERVELVLEVDANSPLMARQNWVRDLGKAGVLHVRFQSNRAMNRADIEVRGVEPNRTFVVAGVLNDRGEIVVSGGRFREGDAGRLARWLKDVGEKGPPKPAEPKAAFGLTRTQFEALHTDLAQPVGFATSGQTRGTVVRRIRDRLRTPIEINAAALRALDSEEVAENLEDMSTGTALAYLLRPAGFCLIPRMTAAGTPVASIREVQGKEEIWPVGWTPRTPELKLVPELYKPHQIRLENIPASEVLSAISKSIGLPVLLDHNALARHGIDPKKSLVSVAQQRTTYDKALLKALYQAGLKREVRVDEAGKAFLWVTTLKPI